MGRCLPHCELRRGLCSRDTPITPQPHQPQVRPHRLQVLHLHVALYQEAVYVPDADGAVQVWLLQEQLALPDRLLGVLGVCPAGSTDMLSPNPGHGCTSGVRAGSRPGGCSF